MSRFTDTGPEPGRRRIVAGLAAADLRHEWILTLCLVLALAAVIAPLLLLLGLKHGTVATLRDRLVQDPVYREIRPAQTREYADDWLDALARRPGVEFLVPTILPASSIIGLVPGDGGRTELFDLIPTASGDPLLLENGGVIPGPGECVLTHSAAQRLGVRAGDRVEARVSRSRGARRETAEAQLRVAAVLEPRAGTLERVYAPLDLVLDVEAYKEGMAAPKRGWPGTEPRPYLSYDGILVVLPEPMDPVAETGLIINTGLTGIRRLPGAELESRTGIVLPPDRVAYDLSVAQGVVHYASYRAVKGKLRGREAVLLPYGGLDGLRVAGQERRVFGLSLSAAEAGRLGIDPPPWGAFQPEPGDPELRQILVDGVPAGEQLELVFRGAQTRLAFPVRVAGAPGGSHAWVPAELAGVLRTGSLRRIDYDAARGRFLLARTGFRGFRLYAADIDDVPPLVRALKADGVEVIAEVQAIERIRVLDRGLTRIFWLVAVVGIAGGIAALIASLYAAVERKKQELSVMRLIGLSRLDVFQFPVYQGAAVAGLSLLLAGGAYLTLARVINRVFSADLELGQRICELPPSYVAAAAGSTLGVALLASLFASWRTTRIDPAEALRYE